MPKPLPVNQGVARRSKAKVLPLPVNPGVTKKSKPKALPPLLIILLLVILAVVIVVVLHFAFHLKIGTLLTVVALVTPRLPTNPQPA